MEKIINLKENGNKMFSEGKFREACKFYGESLEAMIVFESSAIFDKDNIESFTNLKPKIFLNLATANFKLGAYDSCRLCCNACLLYCNNPQLHLNDMGVDNDLSDDTRVSKPILPVMVDLITKSLYRRAQSYYEIGKIKNAMIDFQSANDFSPADPMIRKQIFKLEQQLSLDNRELSNTENYIPNTDILYLTHNGGKCLSNQAFWSQTTSDLKIFYPLKCLILLLNEKELLNNSNNKFIIKLFKIEFKMNCLNFYYSNQLIRTMLLRGSISIGSSTWMMESVQTAFSVSTATVTNEEMSLIHTGISIHLDKAVSVREWSPGIEWWDSVFLDDKDRIDTTTCSIGSDVDQLPDAAIRRGEKQQEYFNQLTSNQQSLYMNDLTKLLQDSRCSPAVNHSDNNMEPMLNALRTEFPDKKFFFHEQK